MRFYSLLAGLDSPAVFAVAAFFSLLLEKALSIITHTGPDRQTEENRPATRPTISGSAKFRIESTPKMNTSPMVNSVVSVVFTERDSDCHMLVTTVSPKLSDSPARFLFSLTRSNITIVAFIE